MTDTYDAGDVTLRNVRDNVWEIPQEGNMRVPARVFASEALLDEISDDRTLEQLRNTTHLPGIRNYAICMPDGHQGYGFPVGGVAGIDAEDGCISPGAVGYDINCLPKETSVRLSFGRKASIANLRDRFETERAMVATGDDLVSSPIRLFTESGHRTVYELETETGEQIEATGDHPFRTPDGMVELEDLEPGDAVFVQPFEGIEHESPDERVVLSADDVSDANPQLRRALEDRGLLPLETTDDAFHHLLGILGYFLGDGSFGEEGQCWFYGDPADLESIRDDVTEVGFEPSKVTGYSFETTSKAFRRILVELGAPEEPNLSSGYTTPDYFDALADWQRGLFYSAYFGAEMNTPAADATTLDCPTVSQTRSVDTADAGKEFFADLSAFLEDVGIETHDVEPFETGSNSDHETVGLCLGIKNDSTNLIRFYTTVGFRYAGKKQVRAAKAVKYLRTKDREIRCPERIPEEAEVLADGGVAFPDFEEFCEQVDVGEDVTVETEIRSIEGVGKKPVYDIGVANDAHNFVANEFVVSNCGVRMMRTNLTYDDLKGREAELVDALFANIPSGLGGGGVVHTDKRTIDDILDRGMEWALDEGWAVPEDLEHCEDEGTHDSDPSKVSEKAKNRGKEQVGSLGSGNHFLEVQRVTDVYVEDVADAYGLEPDRIVVLIHCGSRGLGHQVCTDYLRKIENEHRDLLNRLPDKELAAAPAGSSLAEDYYDAMGAAINYAWTNRQLIMHRTREVFERVFGRDWRDMEMYLLYDVAHNIAKKEVHEIGVDPDGRPAPPGGAVDTEEGELYVHRKGATRAFPAGRPEIPAAHRDVGQPVIIPGSMGAGSYVLRGGKRSMTTTFGSTAHGAGRLMSRTQAKQTYWGGDVQDDLREQQQVYVKAQSGATVAEEAPGVYKDVDEVVRVSDALDIGDRVARTYPVCNIKG
jgi:tRNA-splicing ligase RtcB